ncbi:MAG: hypothetical protein A4E29_01338 [Methanomassiliicoccales archaeon PtaB.Bin134]|nr:MAG: hypothetical protein A4E29_01338 [Methanomassiliicoccales archaeon PtaB.Bin134]
MEVLLPGQARCAGRFRGGEGAAGAGSPQGRGRVRQSDQLRGQPPLLRGEGDEGLRDVPGTGHDHYEGGGVRGGRHPILPPGGNDRPRLDRASEVPHQGKGVAPRRGPSVHGAGRGAGPQRGFRQLPLGQRVSGPEERDPAVLNGHRGFRPAVRPAEQDLPLPAGVRHRGFGTHHREGFPQPARGQEGDISGHTAHAYPRLPGRPLVLHHRPQLLLRRWQIPADRNHRHGHAQAAGLRPGGGGGADRPHRFGEAGHRFRAALHRRGPPLSAQAGGRILERPGRKPHRRRGLRVHPGEGGRKEMVELQQQVRGAGEPGPDL